MSRWMRFGITEDEVIRGLRALYEPIGGAFVLIDLSIIAMSERNLDVQLASGRRTSIPLRALRHCDGRIVISRNVLIQKGLPC